MNNKEIKECLEKNELGKILEEQEKIFREIKNYKIGKDFLSKWGYCMLVRKYCILEKRRYELYKIIQNISFKIML